MYIDYKKSLKYKYIYEDSGTPLDLDKKKTH